MVVVICLASWPPPSSLASLNPEWFVLEYWPFDEGVCMYEWTVALKMAQSICMQLPWDLMSRVAVLETHAQQVRPVAVVDWCLSASWRLPVHRITARVALILSSHQHHCHHSMAIWPTLLRQQNLLETPVILSHRIHMSSWLRRQSHRVLINSLHWVASMHTFADIFLFTVLQTKAGRYAIFNFYWQSQLLNVIQPNASACWFCIQ